MWCRRACCLWGPSPDPAEVAQRFPPLTGTQSRFEASPSLKISLIQTGCTASLWGPRDLSPHFGVASLREEVLTSSHSTVPACGPRETSAHILENQPRSAAHPQTVNWGTKGLAKLGGMVRGLRFYPSCRPTHWPVPAAWCWWRMWEAWVSVRGIYHPAQWALGYCLDANPPLTPQYYGCGVEAPGWVMHVLWGCITLRSPLGPNLL